MRINKLIELQRKQKLEKVWDEGDLKLGEDPIPGITVVNCLRIIGKKLITYENTLPLIKRTLISYHQVKYV